MKGYQKFWFMNGGYIHGVWKRRQWSQLKKLANELPEAAWNTALEEAAQMMETWHFNVEGDSEFRAAEIRKLKTGVSP